MSSAATLIQRKGVLVSIQRPTVTVDAGGSPLKTWQTVATVRMFRQPNIARKQTRYGAERSQHDVTFYAPVGANVRESDQLIYGGETVDVKHIHPPGTFGAGEATSHLVIEADRVVRNGVDPDESPEMVQVSQVRAFTVVESVAPGIAWQDAANALVDDAANSQSPLQTGQMTATLRFSGAGFDIPAAATNLRYALSVRHRAFQDVVPFGSVQDATVRMRLGSIAIGDNKASETSWSNTVETVTYGDDSDNWGIVLAPGQVNDSAFGVDIAAAEKSGNPIVAQIYFVAMTVYWEEPA